MMHTSEYSKQVKKYIQRCIIHKLRHECYFREQFWENRPKFCGYKMYSSKFPILQRFSGEKTYA